MAPLGASGDGHERMAWLLSTHGSGGLQDGVDLDDAESLNELIGDNTGSQLGSAD